jgi:hypothetical protein
VGDAVFAVAPAGRSEAPGEDAGEVADLGLLREAFGDLIGVDVDVLVEVDDGFDDNRGVGTGAPRADLVGGDAAALILDPGQFQ